MTTMGEVNEILITTLRNKVLTAVEDINTDHYHENDIERIQNDDSWVRRFILHHEYDMDQAFHMVMECLKWRKEFGVHDITETSLPQKLFETEIIYPYARDKEDNKILMFHIRLYRKGQESMPDMKRFLVYWMEKLDKDEKGHPITVVFDMKDSGFTNMDMDFVKFFISLFKFYYPSFLGYLIVFEMPWILNAAWKLIKTWLSARAVEKIKFVNKSTIQEYVSPDQLPELMGGTNTLQYDFETIEEEEFSNLIENNGPLPTPKKKVHFAETDSDSVEEVTQKSDAETHSPVSMRCHTDSRREDALSFSGKLLRISPADELIFTADGTREPCATINLTNNTMQCVAFKVKTTSPEKYRVRPSSGIIRPHCQCEVVVQLQSLYQTTSLGRDKFLVMAIALEHADMSSQELCDIWRLTLKDKIMEYKLRCSLTSNCPNIYSCPEPTQCGPTSGATEVSKQMEILERLMSQVADLRMELCYMRRLVLIVIAILVFLLIILFIMIRFGIEPFIVKKTVINSCVGPNIA